MQWIHALRKFITLLLAVFAFIFISVAAINAFSSSAKNQRLDISVIKNIINIIYLNKSGDDFVFEFSDQNLPQKLLEMTYYHFSEQPEAFPAATKIKPDSCHFLEIELISENYSLYEPIFELFKNEDCVFIQSPYEQVRAFFSEKKPRWLFGIPDVAWQKSKFYSSIFLPGLSPLKGDFILLKMKDKELPPRLLNEIKNRDLIIFQHVK